MYWFLLALGDYLREQWRPIVYPLLGAIIGASLGSVRRNSGSRWQSGLFAGLCVGYSLEYWAKSPHCVYHILAFSTDHLQFLVDFSQRTAYRDVYRLITLAAASLGGLAACVTAVAASRWIAASESPTIIAWRNKPSAWLTSRFTGWIVPAVVLLAVGCYLSTHFAYLDDYAQVLKCDYHFPRLKEKWKPYEVLLERKEGQGRLQLEVNSARGLSDVVLADLATTGCRFEPIYLMGEDLGDADILRIAPYLRTAEYIYLRCPRVTDAGLLALTNCPKLNQLSVIDCFSVTDDGLERFHQLRPGVKIRMHNGLRTMTFPGRK